MMIIHRFAAAAAALLLCTALAAQTGYEDAIREDPDRAAGVHHSYEYIPSAETPAPRGYTAFYVSHYGRHGSRRSTKSSAHAAFEYMTAAHDAGILTPRGEQLFEAVVRIHDDHVGMVGELTDRGAREHRAIARRLYGRYPRVWRNKNRNQVYVQSSNIPRCLVSMANFISSLDECSPQLTFDFITGDKYLDLMAHDYFDQDSISAASSRLLSEMALTYFDPTRFVQDIFTVDAARIEELVEHPLDIIYQVFMTGGIRQCTETPDAEIFRNFFTVDELINFYRCYNSVVYNSMGNSAEFSANHLWAARGLLQDFIDRADAALADDSPKAADLRFGHDSGILPLAGLMDLIGPGDCVPAAEASDSWQSYRRVPMASNLQLVFFRKKGAEPLVKIYYNEEETLVRDLAPVQGPYYRWSDLKAHFERRIAQFSFE
jgi:hypothetical protein